MCVLKTDISMSIIETIYHDFMEKADVFDTSQDLVT